MALPVTPAALETNQRKGGRHFLFAPSRVLVAQSWFLACFSALVPLGSLGGIYSAIEGRRSARAASFTITWKFPARSRICWTLYPAPGLIPAVLRESWSVTEQITVNCFLSRPDPPTLTAEAAALPSAAARGATVHRCRLWTCELHQ